MDNTCFNNKNLDWICDELSNKLGFCIHKTDVRYIETNCLYQPLKIGTNFIQTISSLTS